MIPALKCEDHKYHPFNFYLVLLNVFSVVKELIFTCKTMLFYWFMDLRLRIKCCICAKNSMRKRTMCIDSSGKCCACVDSVGSVRCAASIAALIIHSSMNSRAYPACGQQMEKKDTTYNTHNRGAVYDHLRGQNICHSKNGPVAPCSRVAGKGVNSVGNK